MPTTDFEGLRYDPSDGTLRAPSGEPLTLRPQVASLLEVFLQCPNEVLDRDTLYRAVWGEDRVVDFEAGLAALIKELRQALRSVGAEPTLIETVPRRGYRFHGAVESGATSDAGAATAPASRRLPYFIAGIAGLVLAIVFIAWVVAPGDEPAPTPRLAVVPFDLLGEAGSENLDLVLADTLLAALWQRELDGLVLLGRTSIGSDLAGPARVEFVAGELEASLILEGSVIRDAANAGGWRIEARLLQLPRGEVIWTSTVAGEEGEAIAVGDVAAALVDDLAQRWPDRLDER